MKRIDHKPKREHVATTRVMARPQAGRVTVHMTCSCTARAKFVSVSEEPEAAGESKTRIMATMTRRGKKSRCPALVSLFRRHFDMMDLKRAIKAIDHE